MTDNETTADIIAWLRKPREGENAYLTLWRDEIADRLEAALKRELSKNVSKNGADFGQLGDAAKLREALKRAWLFVSATRESFAFVHEGRIERDKLCEDIDAALAAPPRNCDLARDWMRDLYAHFQPPASVKREMPPEWVDAVMAFCRWLIAPATEQEGGNK